MSQADSFSGYHPLVNFAFFGVVLGFSMLSMHPLFLAISLAGAIGYYVRLKGARAVGLLAKGALPLFLMTVIINPAFSHAGETFLCYLPSGNPLTLESILYGVDAGVMLVSILVWFACFSLVMTSDKFVYLFGRLIPALSLVLSMTLRFIPRFKTQFDAIREAQGMLGRDTSNGTVLNRLKNAIVCFSIVVTWGMENAIETSDSMKSRGFGTTRRTAYSVYRFTERDRDALVVIILVALILISGGLSGDLFWRFYPNIRGVLFEPLTIVSAIAYFLICFIPLFINRREDAIWKRLRSNI